MFDAIKNAFYSLVSKDDSAYPKGQVTTYGKASDFLMLSVYGVCSNPVEGSHVMLFNARGQESTQFGIINDFLNRKKNLKEGETVLINTKTGGYVFLKENGNMELLGSGDNAVRFTPLKTEFDKFKDEVNAFITKYNGHKHIYIDTISGTPTPSETNPTLDQGVDATADITPAKIDEIEVPA